jgi:ComF family protein
MPRILRELALGLGDALFPPVCVHCRGLVEGGPYRHLCAGCAAQLAPARPPLRGRAAVISRGPARSLVIELKYHRGLHVVGDMAEILRRAPGVAARVRAAVLVPVPLHPRKQRERGYNQSALLARALARAEAGGARVEEILRRVSDTPTQTALGRRERRLNLKNAFALARRPHLDPRQRYILVDDVFTTGSTLASCARTLRRAGCLKLDILTYGHG